MTPTPRAGVVTAVPRTLLERFWSKADTSAGLFACWPWRSKRTDKGYGMFSINGRDQRAHRVAWGLANGPIPDGLLVLHECDNPPCCNPAHLHLGTDQDNNREMSERGRRAIYQPTHCKHGHEFTPENTRWRGVGQRRWCRACRRLSKTEYRQRRRTAV